MVLQEGNDQTTILQPGLTGFTGEERAGFELAGGVDLETDAVFVCEGVSGPPSGNISELGNL